MLEEIRISLFISWTVMTPVYKMREMKKGQDKEYHTGKTAFKIQVETAPRATKKNKPDEEKERRTTGLDRTQGATSLYILHAVFRQEHTLIAKDTG